MAYIRTRHRTDGTPYFSVYYREGGRAGRQLCISWDDYQDAEHCKQLIEQVGGEKAREIMRIVQAPRHSQTVVQYRSWACQELRRTAPGAVGRR